MWTASSGRCARMAAPAARSAYSVTPPSGDLQVTPVPPERTTGTAIADDRKGSATRLPDLPRVPRPYGDRLFDTVVGSKDQAVLGTRMGAVAHRIRMPIPDLNGQPILGWDLRLFLADVIEHAQATDNQNVINTLQLDPTRRQRTRRRRTCSRCRACSPRCGGSASYQGAIASRSPACGRAKQVALRGGRCHGTAGASADGARADHAVQWQLRPDGSYERIRYPQPKPARELPLGLRALRPPDRPHGASPSEELVHTLVQMIRTADRHAQVTSDELLKSSRNWGSTPLILRGSTWHSSRICLRNFPPTLGRPTPMARSSQAPGPAGFYPVMRPLLLHHDERPDAA